MKNTSPKLLAFLTTFAIVTIQAIIYYIVSLIIGNEINLKIFLLFLVLFFALIYVLLHFIINKFIYDKIKIIYKNINHYKRTDKEKRIEKGEIKENDILNQVENEVKEWAIGQAKEIDELKRMEEYRKEFLGNVMHELKTPVFNIQGYILTLLDGGLEDENINRKYLKKAEKSLNRIISIVHDLENISRLEHGRLVLEYEKFDMAKLTCDIFDILDTNAKNKNVQMRLFGSLTKNVMVYADKERIKQVMSNLILNAINYGVENGEIEVEFIDMDDQILIEISDNGIGIEKNHLNRIFERFYRVDKSRSTKLGGTGLGLSIVKHIIEAHKQTINVRSAVNVGTTFSFTLKKDMPK